MSPSIYRTLLPRTSWAPLLVATLAVAVTRGQTVDRAPARQSVDASPRVVPIPIPPVPGAFAIWGATGQDARGHIWFGVSVERTPVPSAHLFEYDPATATPIDRGNVVDELKKAGLLRANEHQAKIHSHIVAGPDGFLYFSSMDEEGEKDDGSRNPTWGGHLWRLQPSTGRWEHLLAAPEALIAVAGGDRFIYTMGYFGHVVYRFDTRTREIRHLRIGSVDGHVSRNIVADYRGHLFVPRITLPATDAPQPHDPRKTTVTLVELDATFKEIAATPLASELYLDAGVHGINESHGITAFQELPDRSILINTHAGRRYRIAPPPPAGRVIDHSPAAVSDQGWFNPIGTVYTASMFAGAGARPIFGVSHARTGYQWIACDIDGHACDVSALLPAGPEADRLNRSSLYGSATRDRDGAHYVAGIGPAPAGGLVPLLFKVFPLTSR